MRLLDSSRRAFFEFFCARPTCLGVLAGVGAFFCGEAQANIWDRVVWNDLEMEIQIIPQPLDAFYAKTPFFDNAVALLAPSVAPFVNSGFSNTANGLSNTATRRTAPWTPIAYCDCGGTSYTPPAPPEAPAPVPLPASGWLMLAGLALLRGMRNGRA